MKYRKIEDPEVGISVGEITEDIQPNKESKKCVLDEDVCDGLLTLLGKVTTLKHSHLHCKKTLDTLGKICEYILFILNAYCPEFEYPEIPAVKQASLDPDDLIKMYVELTGDVDNLAGLAAEKNNWLVVKKMQFSLGEIGEALTCLRKKNDN